MCVCVPTADHLSFRPCCGSAALALALAIIPIVLLSLVRLLFSSIWDGLQPLDWVTIVERPVWDTKLHFALAFVIAMAFVIVNVIAFVSVIVDAGRRQETGEGIARQGLHSNVRISTRILVEDVE